MGFRSYLAKRLALSILVIFGTITITFFISRIVPSDPAALWAGSHPTHEQIEKARKMLGLDKPLHVQYINYIKDLLFGDWGYSIRFKRPVLLIIFEHLPATLELVIVGFVIAILIGIPLGVISAVKENKLTDHVTRVVSVIGASMPVFWLAIVLQMVFYGKFGILPLSGRIDSMVMLTSPLKEITGFYLLDSILTNNWIAFKSALLHIILPALCIATYPLGLCTRMVRSSMIEVLRENYIRAARASGLPERYITFRYALKNAITPAMTALGLSFAYTITGAFLTEIIFDWGGIGTYAVYAIQNMDYPLIVGLTVFVSIFYVTINLILDIIQAIIDPRVKY
ncbi:MAG: ABC transporter permease [Candidatus Baldrarchaeia archaeon]